MGSSSRRKPSDTLRIQNPLNINTNAIGTKATGGGTGGSPPLDINNACPIKFRVELSNQDVDEGIELILDENSLIAPNIGEVDKVSARVVKRLRTCSVLGISYSITTVIDGDVHYAEFFQS
ncbi:hypothetical protein FWF89_02145 [Candidatus Saccharibacteria bacterium]|nr:hypothetical protein [Candidatus Saccharibacteria bacterium]